MKQNQGNEVNVHFWVQRSVASLVAALGLTLMAMLPSAAADTNAATLKQPAPDAAAEAAWQEVMAALDAPAVPEAWRNTTPPPEELKQFRAEQGRWAGTAADKVKDFFTRFPNSPEAAEAREQYERLLDFAVTAGNTNKLPELEALEQARLKDPETTEEDRLRLRLGALMRQNPAIREDDPEKYAPAFEAVVRQLMKEFPQRDEPYEMLASLVTDVNEAKARELAREIENSRAPEQVKARVKNHLAKLDRVGKPFPLKFTALNGETVDLEKLKGKVVLLDFWATWCGPCIHELPNVRAAYEKLHSKGFEIVGISFDQSKAQLEKFLEREKLPWPQYFDGKGWGNELGREYGINSIPAMWLVDKQGKLRDLNARGGLVAKVEKLLAE